MKRIEDIKEFKDIDTYYEISKIVDEVFQDRVETHKHLVTANKEIERLNNIIKEQGLEDKPNYYVKGLEGSLKEYQEEVKRLNNVINGLEKGIKENIEELEEHQLSRDRIYEDKEILRFLQELKGSDK